MLGLKPHTEVQDMMLQNTNQRKIKDFYADTNASLSFVMLIQIFDDIICCTEGRWKIRLETSDLHNAATHAQVYITVYGKKKDGTVLDSGKLKLGSGTKDSMDFFQGMGSNFEVRE